MIIKTIFFLTDTIENNKSDTYYNPSRRKEADLDENQTLPNGSYIYFNPTRTKRATHRKSVKTVETLVVVDKHVYWKHGRNNITTYALSMFNIVRINKIRKEKNITSAKLL